MGCLIGVYAMAGLLLYGAFAEDNAPATFKVVYCLVWPIHALVLAQLEGLFDFSKRLGSNLWLDVLWWVAVIAFVLFAVSHG